MNNYNVNTESICDEATDNSRKRLKIPPSAKQTYKNANRLEGQVRLLDIAFPFHRVPSSS